MNKEIIKAESNEFQDAILRSVNHHKGPYLVDILGIDYWMFEESFDPAYAKPAMLLINNQGVEKGDEVLVQFSGPGVDARIAYENGASRVVSAERFEMPWMCSRYNTLRNNLEGSIDNRLGDLFDCVDDERFDLILANPPFRNMISEGKVESALRDEGYVTLKRFWKEVGGYLKECGRVRTVFSDVGDMDYFYSLAKENGFDFRIVAKEKYASSVRVEVAEFWRRG
ncbi:MAG: methyltransferase [Nanoarchaeota archaeon]|jgi:predicted methyltransferase|nr:methyltransferase [Nanoarchaeota archaeon]